MLRAWPIRALELQLPEGKGRGGPVPIKEKESQCMGDIRILQQNNQQSQQQVNEVNQAANFPDWTRHASNRHE